MRQSMNIMSRTSEFGPPTPKPFGGVSSGMWLSAWTILEESMKAEPENEEEEGRKEGSRSSGITPNTSIRVIKYHVVRNSPQGNAHAMVNFRSIIQ